MLNLEVEYKKGILFVRFFGEINNLTKNKLDIVDDMIIKAGIRYLFVNLEKVTSISTNQIDDMINKYKKLIGDDGKLLICGYYNNQKLQIDTNDIGKIYLSHNEVNAFNIINI